MRAAYYSKTGPADVIQIGELPTPVPNTGEVLVKISYSAVNPIDLYIRSGMVAATLPLTFVPNADFAGVVTAVGTGVKRFKVGEQVWGSNQGMATRQGTAAEFAAVHEDWAYPLPNGVKPEDAAAVALTGITALALEQTDDLPDPPKLLRMYMMLGAYICGEPAIDREFKTIDFLTLLDLEHLAPSFRVRYLGHK